MKAKGSSVAKAVLGMTAMVIFGVSIWNDAHLSQHEVVWGRDGNGVRGPRYMERWQVEGIYGVCTIMAATLLVGAIREITKGNAP